MEFTGFTGQLLGWVIMIMAYVTVACGIFIVVTYFLFDYVLTYTLKAFNCYSGLVDYLYNRHEFKEWRKRKDEPTPDIKVEMSVEEFDVNGKTEYWGNCTVNDNNITDYAYSVDELKQCMKNRILEFEHAKVIEFDIKFI